MQSHLKLTIQSTSLTDAIERAYAAAKIVGPAQFVVTIEALSVAKVNAAAPAPVAGGSPQTPASAAGVPAEAPVAAAPSTETPVAGHSQESSATPAAPSGATGVEVPAAPRKRGRPRKTESAQPAVAPSNTGSGSPVQSPQGDAAAPSQAQPVTAAPASASPSKEDVRAALHELVTKRNLELGTGALGRFGAARLSELKPEFYVEFIALCKRAVETGEV